MTTHGDTIRLVPKEPDPFEPTLALIERHGWEETGEAEWRAGEATVRFEIDSETGVQFFTVTGPGREAVAEQIEGEIEMLTVDDFEAYMKRFSSPQGVMQGLYTIASAAPPSADPRVIRIFERSFAHEDPLVRRAALLAASITRWREFREPVARLREDPDEDVRRVAESTLRALGS